MPKLIFILLLVLAGCLSADCITDQPGEIYFTAYSKDEQGKYTVRTLYRTRDYGHTAKAITKNFDYFIYADAQPGCFYKVTSGETLHFSSDTCRTWTYRTHDAGNIFTTRHPAVLYIGVKYSTDFGATWSVSQNDGLPNGGNMCIVCIGYEKGEMWAYDTENFKTYRSTDYGNNFTYVATISPGLEANGMAGGWQAGEVLLGNMGVVYRSTDYGHSFNYYFTQPITYASLRGWQRGEYIGPQVKLYPQMVNTSQKITFFRTTNFYTTIDTVECQFDENGIEENGEWKIENGDLQNYPNPFNNSTVVNYTLVKSSEINLAVYNSKGELVSNLFKGKQDAGTHNINFDATGLNSGVYYIRMKYGSNLKTHKILLVK